VVVLVHGIASSYITFENLIPLLGANHRVIAVDLLGFGASSAPASATFTLEEHVGYLRRTLAGLHLPEPYVLVGHSMGSLSASRYAAMYADKLAGLVLVSPPIYLPPELVGDPLDRTAMTVYRRVYDFLITDLTERRSAEPPRRSLSAHDLAEAEMRGQFSTVALPFRPGAYVTPGSESPGSSGP
jgi:pimeloyl-ACP methyl ester carboxylesterase